jgi:membrane-bound serine protease (ClpP class)
MSAREAYEMGFIDVISEDKESLLDRLDGFKIVKNGVNITLETKHARIEEFEMGLRHVVLSLISDPIINALLFTIGFIALVYGLTTPGLGAEVAGAIMVILALLGTGIDVNLGSVLLMGIGAALLAYELSNPGFGAAGIGGLISLVLGALLLAVKPFSPILVETGYLVTIALSVAIVATGATSFFGVVFYKGIKAIRMKPSYGYDIVGKIGRAVDDIPENGEGFVIIKGEYWKARSRKGVKSGSRVRVLGKDGNILIVEPEEKT